MAGGDFCVPKRHLFMIGCHKQQSQHKAGFGK
jgi:hypothetical protein